MLLDQIKDTMTAITGFEEFKHSVIETHLVSKSCKKTLDVLFRANEALSQYFTQNPLQRARRGFQISSKFQNLQEKVGKIDEISELGIKVLKTKVGILKGSGRMDKAIMVNSHDLMVLSAKKTDNLMRVVFAEKIAASTKRMGIVVPGKKYYPIPLKDPTSVDFCDRYLVVSQELNVAGAAATTEQFLKLPEETQKKVTEKLCDLVAKTGFADTHFGNIRFLVDKKGKMVMKKGEPQLAIIDTESFGLYTMGETGEHFNKCVLVGLDNLKKNCIAAFKTEEAAQHITKIVDSFREAYVKKSATDEAGA